MHIRLYVQYQSFLSDFNKNLVFLKDFRKKNSQLSYFMKIPPTVADLFHANRLADRYEEARSRFLEFYESAIDLQIGVFTQDDEKFGS